MLLAIAGVTGVGKSYYKDKIVEKLGFKKIKIVTTREMRIGEKNAEDKRFVTQRELEKLRSKGEIAYEFELLGNVYAYTKEELFSKSNTVFEMHYNTVYDFKRICPEIKTIYVFPKDIDIAKEKLRERHLNPEVEKKRIKEIDEHYKKIMTDEKLRKSFDYIIYNEYNENSEIEVLELVSKLLNEEING